MAIGYGEIPGGDFLSRRQPHLRLALDIFDKLPKRGDPMWLADDVRMQTDVHYSTCGGSFGMKLIEA